MHSTFRFLPFVILLFGYKLAYMQGVKGRLTDTKNNPIPFAAIYDELTYSGTTSNADGYYDLKLSQGKHSLVFKSLGYYIERRNVETATAVITINLQLTEQAFELKDVIVTPGKEDPAYAIMRKVIGLAPYHLNMVKEYSSDVYLRGSIHITHIPRFIAKRIIINGKKGLIKDGDVYLEESLNQIDFKAPDKYEQKVKSYRTNFPGENNVSPMQIIRSSFYQPKMQDAISPLAPNAFSFYKYRYEGYSKEGENTIFKIKVIPKRNSQQLVSGYIFIIDKLWCLYSVDVSQEMFFGKLDYKEIFTPVKENAWLPISYSFYVNAAIMGIKADYKYTSSVKYQKVQLSKQNITKPVNVAEAKEPAMPPPVKKAEVKKQKTQQEIDRLLTKDDLSNREMMKLAGLLSKEAPKDSVPSKSLEIKDENNTKITIEKDAMKKDTAFWNTMRPIPLTTVEVSLSDSIKSLKTDTTNAKKDSVSIKNKKKESKYSKYLFGGAGFFMFDSLVHIKYDGLLGINKFDFNTVDGFIFKQTFDISLKVDSTHRIKINPGMAYGFSRKALMWWITSSYDYAPLRGGNLKFSYNNSTVDYNQSGGMNSQINALSSLLFRRNYKKFYGESHVNLSNKIDIANGLTLQSKIGYRQVNTLENNTDFSFFYRNTREYSLNIPVGNIDAIDKNLNNTEAYFSVGLEFTPQYYYKIRGGKKQYQHSKYPTFFTTYKRAIPGIFSSTANFDYFEVGAKQTKGWGMNHSFSWSVVAGKFLNQKSIYLNDYKFFNNQPLPIIFGNTRNSFFLPGLYNNYSNQSFVEGHFVFTTPYLLIKYLPFLSNKMWLENLHFSYLYKPNNKLYWEAGYSISQIYALGGIGVFAGFNGTNFKSAGVRITLGF